jgi:hypothetical protein
MACLDNISIEAVLVFMKEGIWMVSKVSMGN